MWDAKKAEFLRRSILLESQVQSLQSLAGRSHNVGWESWPRQGEFSASYVSARGSVPPRMVILEPRELCAGEGMVSREEHLSADRIAGIGSVSAMGVAD